MDRLRVIGASGGRTVGSTESPANHFFLKTLCSNRDLSRNIIINEPLYTQQKIKGVFSVRFIGKPTSSAYPVLSGESMWQLISTLSLSHLSLIDDRTGEALEGLKKILEALDLKNDGRNKKLIKGVYLITSEKTVDCFSQQEVKGWQRGLEMTLTFGPVFYIGNIPFCRFMSGLCTSFFLFGRF